MFLRCSSFLAKFEPRCSYKIVLIKKSVYYGYFFSLVVFKNGAHQHTELIFVLNKLAAGFKKSKVANKETKNDTITPPFPKSTAITRITCYFAG